MLLRQPPGHLHRIPNALAQREDLVDLLQAPAARLGEEEPDTRQPGGIEDGVDDEVAITDVREADGGYLGDEEVEEPRHGGADAADGGAELDGGDLGGVEEGDTEEADGVDDVVELWW